MTGGLLGKWILSRRSCLSGGRQQRVATANVDSGKPPEITPVRGTSTI